ncbi:CalY family protein [Mesobacillus maritimus]|uniref:TasA family protein n=1 Tax=Mesobacillus maritimus TaxID=1643336 RepID=UPI00203F15AB|nr:TasA family protein [Mesobacillus maritimus]MCM3585495.1 CalY family protein [Mesobacillus maritimus]
MGIKKKLGLGVASAALGLSLVGGGTWAAFNDVETLDKNNITAGILDLGINPDSELISLDKLVPGDQIARSFKIANNGNVDIKQVLLDLNVSGWEDVDHHGTGVKNTEKDFLSQFKVNMFAADAFNFSDFGGGTNLLGGITGTGKDDQGKSYISLYDLVQQADGTYDITNGTGLPNGTADEDGKDFDKIWLAIEFVNKDLKDANGEQHQNKFQDETANIEFVFEAIQRDGVTRVNGDTGNSGATE